MPSEKIVTQFQQIKSLLQGKKVIAAYSGGADSTLVLLLCLKYAENVIPVFFSGQMFSESDLVSARKLCGALKMELQLIDYNPLNSREFSSNPPDRCYYCKKMIMQALLDIKNESDYDIVVEGTNISEIEEHRPGLRALREYNVISPLIEGGFTKADVKDALIYIGQQGRNFLSIDLDYGILREAIEYIVSRPSNACLCSRIEYNLKITLDMLDIIQKAESFISQTYDINPIRVRFHRNYLARIEVDEEKISLLTSDENRSKITKELKSLGFKYITIDLNGFRSGSMNE